MARELAPEARRLSEEYDVLVADQSPSPAGGSYLVPGDAAYFHVPGDLTGGLALPGAARGGGPLGRLYRRLAAAAGLGAFERLVCAGAARLKVVANSTWTRDRVAELSAPLLAAAPEPCRREAAASLASAAVVHPPADYESLSSLYDPGSKGGLVLTVSRLAPEKNLWSVVRVAARVPEAHFVVAGSSRGSAGAAAQLEALVDKLRLKNVTLERDVPRRRLVELYEEAKVYLHPLRSEPFGIAIAEGAAAGAVPVVYKDGGGWTDIASRIDQSLGYTNIDEAAAIVRSLLGNEDLWLRLSRRSVEVARDFSWGSYKRKLDAVVREAYELKRRSKARSATASEPRASSPT